MHSTADCCQLHIPADRLYFWTSCFQVETPLEEAKRLSDELGNTILFKREDLQPVHSFKVRGAFNRMSQMTEEQMQKGVICASAGNHAQGVAMAALKLVSEAALNLITSACFPGTKSGSRQHVASPPLLAPSPRWMLLNLVSEAAPILTCYGCCWVLTKAGPTLTQHPQAAQHKAITCL